MYIYYVKWSQFCKDYQKDSYDQRIFIEKNIDDKNILTTFKKHSYFLKCGIIKTLKIQKMFQNCFKISKLQESFTTHKWVIMYMIYEEKLYFRV
jgi:hypothetical protein